MQAFLLPYVFQMRKLNMNTSDFNGLLKKIKEVMVDKKKTIGIDSHIIFHNKIVLNKQSKGISFQFCGLNVQITTFDLFDWDERAERWRNSSDTANSYYVLTAKQNIKMRELINEYVYQ